MNKRVTLSAHQVGVLFEIGIHQRAGRILHEATYRMDIGELAVLAGTDHDLLGQHIGRDLSDQIRKQIAGVKDVG